MSSYEQRRISVYGERGIEGVVERCVLGDPVGREDSGRRQVEREHPVGKRRQNVLVEPATQDRSLLSVGAFPGNDSPLDFRDGEC